MVPSFSLTLFSSLFRLPQQGCWDRLPSSKWLILISFEKGLNRRPLKEQRILLHLLWIVSLEVVISQSLLLVEVVSVLLWLKRSIQLLLEQALPIEFTEPYVLLDLGGSIQSKSITWLTLNALVDKVGGL